MWRYFSSESGQITWMCTIAFVGVGITLPQRNIETTLVESRVEWIVLLNAHVTCCCGATNERYMCLTLNVRDRVISIWLGQYHGCSCLGSLRRQDISSHGIDWVEYVSLGLTWGRILSTCVISMWSNDIKCKYIFMLPLNNLARKGLMLMK